MLEALHHTAGGGKGGTTGRTGIEFCFPGGWICLAKLGKRKDVGRQKYAENGESDYGRLVKLKKG